MYKRQIDIVTKQESDFVQKATDDGSFVFVNKTTDPTYLKWLEDGNTPEPADE